MLTIQDTVTGYTQFCPVTNRKATTLVRTLYLEWFCKYGVPVGIHTDNAREFTEGMKHAMCEALGINETYCGFYAHHQNGSVERAHRFLTESLKVLQLQDRNLVFRGWPEWVKIIACKYNSGWCTSVNDSPHYLVYGMDYCAEFEDNIRGLRQLPMGLETIEKLDKAALRYRREQFEKRCAQQGQQVGIQGQDDQFIPGDVVWQVGTKTGKKFSPNQGPYRVLEVEADNVYKVGELTSDKNVQRLAGDNLRLCSSLDGQI